MSESTHCDFIGRPVTDPLDDGIEMRPRIDGSAALIIATAPKTLTSNWWTFMCDTTVRWDATFMNHGIGRYLGAIHLSRDSCFDVLHRRGTGIKFMRKQLCAGIVI